MQINSDTNDNKWSIAEANFIVQELKNEFYSEIEKQQEILMELWKVWLRPSLIYERPKYAQLKMKVNVSSCFTDGKLRRIYMII